MGNFSSDPNYQRGQQPTNASWVGSWFLLADVKEIGFIVNIPGTSNPTATISLDLSNDVDPNGKADSALVQPPVDWPLTAAQKTAANPAGAGVAIATHILFTGAGDAVATGLAAPMPRAKWARLKYNRSAGGSAAAFFTISVALQGAGS